MEKIRSLYEKHGGSEYYGEPVTQYQHALQSAYHAEQYNPNDNELIIDHTLYDELIRELIHTNNIEDENEIYEYKKQVDEYKHQYEKFQNDFMLNTYLSLLRIKT